MKFDILKPRYFPAGQQNFGIEWDVVKTLEAASPIDALKKAKKLKITTPVVSPHIARTLQ